LRVNASLGQEYSRRKQIRFAISIYGCLAIKFNSRLSELVQMRIFIQYIIDRYILLHLLN